ncbi:AsmA family protein [Polynucleobacter necessarius]|uniref:AsmA family protein n=1 Tax=Polynucleobacter necessarius TaxID=576610 RepID=UPI000E09528B|nr:AsmA family protein [Polynucleobacter necessarius]
MRASFVNPTQLTKLLSSSVKEATGRELAIAGPVSLSVFPTISVKAEQVSLSNATWASNTNMLTLKQIELDVRLMPLLKGSIEIGRIGLLGLQMNLQTNQAGDGNWNLTPPSTEPGKAREPTSSGDTNSSAMFVSYSAIDIVDTQINYQDASQKTKVIQIPKLAIGISDGSSNILMDLKYANYTLGLKGKTSLLRNAIRDWNQSPVKVDLDLGLTLNGKLLAITGVIDKQLQKLPQFQINLNSKSFDLAPLAGSALVAGSAGKFSAVASPQSQEKYFFSDEALPFNVLPVADGIVNINIDQLELPGQAPFTNFKTTLQFKKNRIDANDLSFNVGKGSANVQFSIADLNAPSPKIFSKGLAKGFSVEQLLASTGSSSSVSGGETQLAWNLKGSGLSLHQLVSRANGVVQLSVGKGTVDTQFLNKGGDFVIALLNAINSLYKKTKIKMIWNVVLSLICL